MMSGPILAPHGLASVIVRCSERSAAETRRCITALARHTRSPWELVAVADGSDGATAAYLAGVRDVAPFPVTILTEDESHESPAARSRELAAARGEYVVLLDGGAVVTDGWLAQLIALANMEPSIGMASPVSNIVGPTEANSEAPYADPEELDRFASAWRRERRGRWLKATEFAGPCLLLKRRVIEALGLLGDPLPARPSGLDLVSRARRAGFELAVALDLYVHHSIDGEFSDTARRDVTTPPRRRQRVSLTMIVRDEEENLPACLASAEGLFDEIVVVDTGSTDRTVEIARSFGARVFDFVWVDDFAAARNAALARATGDYAFWLDADDRLEPPQRDRLRALFAGLDAADSAHVVRCSCDPEPGSGGATVVDHVRLFPIREDVRWTYRVHEQILPALRRVGVEVRWTDAVVRHVGYNDPAVRRGKLVRDRAILESELTGRPDDPFVLFNLGQISLEVDDQRGALEFLRRSLAGSSSTDSIAPKLYALIARAHQRLGEFEEALTTCADGLAAIPDDAELLFRKGVLHRLRGEGAEAASCWNRILVLKRPERFASVDEGIYGHVTRRNLAVLAEERGDRDEAARHWKAVLVDLPDDPEAARALACPASAVLAAGTRRS